MSWQELARGQHGVITRAQLRSTGLSDRQIDRLLRAGHLMSDGRRGVLRSAAVAPTRQTQCWAAVCSTRSVLSHFSAAGIWRLEAPADKHIHVTAPRRRSTRMPNGVRVHRVWLPVGAVISHRGLPITTKARTVLDCLSLLRGDAAATLFDRALQQSWLTVAHITARLTQEPGRQGNTQLRRLLRDADQGDAKSERLLHSILRGAGISGWTANTPITIGGMTLSVDICFAAHRVVVEFDGWAYHHDVARFRADRTRRNALTLAGWRVLQFTWADLQRPDRTARTIRDALALSSGLLR